MGQDQEHDGGNLTNMIPLPPSAADNPPIDRARAGARTHQAIDERSLALHRLVVEKIRSNPELFDQVRATLRRWRTIVSLDAQPYLIEWESLIDQGMRVALAVAVEDSERARALRQSSPFCGVLSSRERSAFLRAWRDQHAAGLADNDQLTLAVLQLASEPSLDLDDDIEWNL